MAGHAVALSSLLRPIRSCEVRPGNGPVSSLAVKPDETASLILLTGTAGTLTRNKPVHRAGVPAVPAKIIGHAAPEQSSARQLAADAEGCEKATGEKTSKTRNRPKKSHRAGRPKQLVFRCVKDFLGSPGFGRAYQWSGAKDL